jgi:hypothetical protein
LIDYCWLEKLQISFFVHVIRTWGKKKTNESTVLFWTKRVKQDSGGNKTLSIF